MLAKAIAILGLVSIALSSTATAGNDICVNEDVIPIPPPPVSTHGCDGQGLYPGERPGLPPGIVGLAPGIPEGSRLVDCNSLNSCMKLLQEHLP